MSNQESIVRSFLRKISPNRDWDYLGEHEHAMIADFIDDIAATLGATQDERIAALEALVRDIHRDMHGCWYCHNCGSCDRDECMFEERMRELGVM